MLINEHSFQQKRDHEDDEWFTFQQGNNPKHKTRATSEWCVDQTFICPNGQVEVHIKL